MDKYYQPNNYNFTEDSLKLVNYILDNINEVHSFIDIGTGCGIVALELYKKLEIKPEMILIEKNQLFLESILNNLEKIKLTKKVKILIQDFIELDLNKKVDLIVTNPPYYSRDKSRLPKEKMRLECHFFMDQFFENLMKFSKKKLTDNGRLIFCYPIKGQNLYPIGLLLEKNQIKYRVHLDSDKLQIFDVTF